ncbi:MAG: hypothetical protein SWH68_03040 [Thermodesulfobacteriota bacterium]|nr:hypothetical protein [Thermodesulfobacteriota bacterium]
MFKKFINGIIVAGTVVVFAGSASAATYNVVGGGASAQGQFWRTAGEAFMRNELHCNSVILEGTTADQEEDAVLHGENCDAGAYGLSAGDEVNISYLEEASYFGCQKAVDSQIITVVDPATCDFTTGKDWDCTGTRQIAMDVGCADVRCTSIDQTSEGWEDGRRADYGDNENYIENCETGDCDATWTSYGNPNGYGWDASQNMVEKEGIVVPFALGVNNSVTKTSCTEPKDLTGDNAHMAYNKWGWQCVPGAQACMDGYCEDTSDACTQNTRYVLDGSGNVVLASGACPVSTTLAAVDQSNDCVGYYKCDHGGSVGSPEWTDEGTCAGGPNYGQSCQTAQECAGDIANTECVAQPIDNLSRLQALLIFSGEVNNWKTFGPWYPDLPIVQCMRHAGSGTHATWDKAIFRGDKSFLTSTVVADLGDNNWSGKVDWKECEVAGLCGTPANTPHPNATSATGDDVTVWHYRSSTDLTYDCIDFYDGGIGYIDADKILGHDDTSDCHTIKLEGVEPTREKVKFGEYIYWSAQQCQYDADSVDAVDQYIIEGLMDYAADAGNLTNEAFGTSADWWATSGEMTVTKTSDVKYPSAK